MIFSNSKIQKTSKINIINLFIEKIYQEDLSKMIFEFFLL